MANIDTYLQAIMDAVYGEQVRGSIHDAISLINNVSEAVLTIGTAVTSPTSSSTGFFEDSLYVNSNTWDLWKCTGIDTWSLEGNIKGETGNGIASITKTSTSVLTDTYTILFTDGTHTTFDVTNGKGIVSIAKTSTSGLVDTYTITFNDSTTQTFDVTNGINGNRWFRGTDISGKAVNPTVYSGSGITDARPNDYYLNPSEGAVYYCVTGGDASTATWSYELTMSGGGGGGNLADLGDVDLTGLDDGMILMYDATSTKWEAKAIVFSDLTDVVINSPADGELMTYDSTAGKWKNKKPDKSFVRYAGAINFADLVTYANTYLTEEYEDAFFLMRTSGTIGTGEASSYWSSNFHDGDEIPADSHIAVININRGTLNPAVYKYDDFGGFVDLSTVDEKGMITENDAYDPIKSYVKNEFLIHNEVLYKVKADCTGVEPPNSTYYEITHIDKELEALKKYSYKSYVNNAQQTQIPGFTSGSQVITYEVGGLLVVCFTLTPTSDIAVDSTNVHDFLTLDTITPNLNAYNFFLPYGDTESKGVQIRVRGGVLSYYVPYGWKSAWQVRGQLVSPLLV